MKERNKVRELYVITMVKYMKVGIKMIKEKELVNLFIRMVISMKVNFMKIFDMVKENILVMLVMFLQVNINMIKKIVNLVLILQPPVMF